MITIKFKTCVKLEYALIESGKNQLFKNNFS